MIKTVLIIIGAGPIGLFAIVKNEKKLLLNADHFIPLFGMLSNLNPIRDWRSN